MVWDTKYRKKVLVGEVAKRVRELLREICKSNEVEIIKGHISKDHVHMFVSVPPHISVSQLMQKLKEKSSRTIMSEFKSISKQFWGRHFWARGYFVASSGNVTDEVIVEYIKNQKKEDEELSLLILDDTLSRNQFYRLVAGSSLIRNIIPKCRCKIYEKADVNVNNLS